MSFTYIPKHISKAERSRDKLRRACDLLKEVIKELNDTPFYDSTGDLADASDAMEDFYEELDNTIRMWEGD